LSWSLAIAIVLLYRNVKEIAREGEEKDGRI
jgi:hypothetical protein